MEEPGGGGRLRDMANSAAHFGAILMIVLLALVLACMAGMVIMARWLRRRDRLEEIPDFMFNSPEPAEFPNAEFLPRETPSCWLAVRCRDSSRVQRVFGIQDARPCSWEEGVANAKDHPLFISPVIAGWVLVFGSRLPDPAEDVDECFKVLAELSRCFGQVQYFKADAILHHHAWMRLDGGRVQRAYAWAGETVWNQGRMTFAEKHLSMCCHEYGEASRRDIFDPSDHALTNVEKVPALASRWSLDPSGIDRRLIGSARGVAGDGTFAGLR